jgi:hypothetical protein
MITAIVNFKLPADIDSRKAAELFRGSAPKYRGMKGLVRKYYLFDDKSRIGGGYSLTISTRRFLARPASSSFEATGAMRPAPTGFSRPGAMP